MNQKKLEELRVQYPEGTEVVLDEMKGESQMAAGLHGTIQYVDDAGQVHVKWQNGSHLALVPEEDSFHMAEEEGIRMELS